MQFIPTNDVFHHLVLLLRLHKDRELLQDMFKAQGMDVSNSLIRAWRNKTGQHNNRMYREMPREALDKFIDECHNRQFIEIDSPSGES
ncbi:hypothetical protein [Endozoicomonas sp. ALB091]|uniref:hypothetical protein n=1 Tax=Endozoicomonas sp. ALB091 TaxID=3403073 RepID=UPI003BB5F55F